MGANHDDECPCSLPSGPSLHNEDNEVPKPTRVGETGVGAEIAFAGFFGSAFLGLMKSTGTRVEVVGVEAVLDEFEERIDALVKQKSFSNLVKTANSTKLLVETFGVDSEGLSGNNLIRCQTDLVKLDGVLANMRTFPVYEECADAAECNLLRPKFDNFKILGRMCFEQAQPESAITLDMGLFNETVEVIKDSRPFIARRANFINSVVSGGANFSDGTAPDPFLLEVILREARDRYNNLREIDVSDGATPAKRKRDTERYLSSVKPGGRTLDETLERGNEILERSNRIVRNPAFRRKPLASPEVAEYISGFGSDDDTLDKTMLMIDGERIELKGGAKVFSSPKALYNTYSAQIRSGTPGSLPRTFDRIGFRSNLCIVDDFVQAESRTTSGALYLYDFLNQEGNWTDDLASNLEAWFKERLRLFVMVRSQQQTLVDDNLLLASLATSVIYEPFQLGERVQGGDRSVDLLSIQNLTTIASLGRRIITMALMPMDIHNSELLRAARNVSESLENDFIRQRWCFHLAARNRTLFDADTFFPIPPPGGGTSLGMLRPIDFPEPIAQEWFVALAYRSPISDIVDCLEGSCLFPREQPAAFNTTMRVNMSYHGALRFGASPPGEDVIPAINYNQGALPFLGGQEPFSAKDAQDAIDFFDTLGRLVDSRNYDESILKNIQCAFLGIILHSLTLYGEFTTPEINDGFYGSDGIQTRMMNMIRQSESSKDGVSYGEDLVEGTRGFLEAYKGQMRSLLFERDGLVHANTDFQNYLGTFERAVKQISFPNTQFSLDYLEGYVNNLSAIYLYFWSKVTLYYAWFRRTNLRRNEDIAEKFQAHVVVRPPGVSSTRLFGLLETGGDRRGTICISGIDRVTGNATYNPILLRNEVHRLSNNNRVDFRSEETSGLVQRASVLLVEPNLELASVLRNIEILGNDLEITVVPEPEGAIPLGTSGVMDSISAAWSSFTGYLYPPAFYSSQFSEGLLGNSTDENNNGLFQPGSFEPLDEAKAFLGCLIAGEVFVQAFNSLFRKRARQRDQIYLVAKQAIGITVAGTMVFYFSTVGDAVEIKACRSTAFPTPIFKISQVGDNIIPQTVPIWLHPRIYEAYDLIGLSASYMIIRAFEMGGLTGVNQLVALSGGAIGAYSVRTLILKQSGSFQDNIPYACALLLLAGAANIGQLYSEETLLKVSDGGGFKIILGGGAKKALAKKISPKGVKFAQFVATATMLNAQRAIKLAINHGIGEMGKESPGGGDASSSGSFDTFGLLLSLVSLHNIVESVLYEYFPKNTDEANTVFDDFAKNVSNNATRLANGDKLIEVTLSLPAQVAQVVCGASRDELDGDNPFAEGLVKILGDLKEVGILAKTRELNEGDLTREIRKQYGNNPPSVVFHIFLGGSGLKKVKCRIIVNHGKDMIGLDSPFYVPDPSAYLKDEVLFRTGLGGPKTTVANQFSRAFEDLGKIKQTRFVNLQQDKIVTRETTVETTSPARRQQVTTRRTPAVVSMTKDVQVSDPEKEVILQLVSKFLGAVPAIIATGYIGNQYKTQGAFSREVITFYLKYIAFYVVTNSTIRVASPFKSSTLADAFTEEELSADPRARLDEFLSAERAETALAEVAARAPTRRGGAGPAVVGPVAKLVTIDFSSVFSRRARGTVTSADIVTVVATKDDPYVRGTKIINPRNRNPFKIILNPNDCEFFDQNPGGRVVFADRAWGSSREQNAALDVFQEGMTVIIDSSLRDNVRLIKNIQARIKTGARPVEKLV